MKRKKCRFSNHPSIENSFTGEQLTSYSGINPLSKFIDKTGMRKKLNRLFPTTEYKTLKFLNVQVLLSILFASLAGVNRISRITNMSSDPLIMKLLGLTKAFNKDVISTRLKSLGQSGALILHDYFQKTVHDFIAQKKNRFITLDVDSTVQSVCGKQEGTGKGYNSSKKGARSYHNLIGFISEFKLVINSWFRDGTAYTANGVCEFTKEIHARFPKNIKGVFFRADSGFFNGKLFTQLETWKWRYLVKVKFRGLKEMLEKKEWIKNEDGNEYCTFMYQCGSWDVARQFYAVRKIDKYKEVDFLGKIEYLPLYVYSCFCSNLHESAKSIYKKYRERSTSETWIEEVKSQAMAGSTLTNSYHANEILWILSCMAYNIGVMVRSKAKGKDTREHKTFKDLFVLVPGKFVNISGKLKLKIYENYYYRDEWTATELSLE